MYLLLSYPLTERTPLYGDTPAVNFTPLKEIRKNDSCNTTYVSFCTHSGTHIDAPLHFSQNDRSVTDFSIQEYIFEKPLLIDCPKDPGTLITKENILPWEFQLLDCDLLLIRTGFSKFRGQDIYRTHNPGLSPCLAEHVVANCPNVRAIGLDSISVSSFQQRQIGRQTHQILLSQKDKKRSLLIIEDMKLPDDAKVFKKVFVIPTLLDGLDGAPTTVFAEL